jgi:hypothetical protein
MEKLIKDLNLTTLVDETDNLVKISLSPYHSNSLAQAIDDYYTDHLNNHIALGWYSMWLLIYMQIFLR